MEAIRQASPAHPGLAWRRPANVGSLVSQSLYASGHRLGNAGDGGSGLVGLGAEAAGDRAIPSQADEAERAVLQERQSRRSLARMHQAVTGPTRAGVPSTGLSFGSARPRWTRPS